MVSMTAILSVAAAVATSVKYVQAHGYMEIPKAEFVGGTTSTWIVQIEPQWEGDWDNAGGDEGLVELYKELKAAHNLTNIRSMLDSDMSLYGADCGYTDPNATPKDPPTDSTATFSRSMGHAGPCEIWLDDEMVLSNDDCQSAFGMGPNYSNDGSPEPHAVLKPLDYSKCASDGCMFRLYWLALQGQNGKIVWQVYKDCVPLSGPPAGTTSTVTEASATGSSELSEVTETEPPETATPEATETEAPETAAPEATETEAPETAAPEAEAPAGTQAPSSMCTARKRN